MQEKMIVVLSVLRRIGMHFDLYRLTVIYFPVYLYRIRRNGHIVMRRKSHDQRSTLFLQHSVDIMEHIGHTFRLLQDFDTVYLFNIRKGDFITRRSDLDAYDLPRNDLRIGNQYLDFMGK